MVLVAEALSDYSRKFTKQSLVSKQALPARGLALDYHAGPSVPGTKLHLFLGGMAWTSSV